MQNPLPRSGVVEKEAVVELRYKVTAPTKCATTNCRGSKFKQVQRDQPVECTDYQEIRIQVKLLCIFPLGPR